MLARALRSLNPEDGSVVFIENVGNLVCPALFDLGERSRVVLASTTEGEDKPLKYPHMFRSADLVPLTKADCCRTCRSSRSASPSTCIASTLGPYCCRCRP